MRSTGSGRPRSPTPHSCGAELNLDAGADLALSVAEGFEYGVFVVAGSVVAEATTAGVDQLIYLGDSRRSIRLRSPHGGRVIMLGGQPFAEDVVMWWNFIGRSHQEIVEFRTAWESRDPRFPPIVSRAEKVMEAPPMPTVTLSRDPGGAGPSEPGAGPAGDRFPAGTLACGHLPGTRLPGRRRRHLKAQRSRAPRSIRSSAPGRKCQVLVPRRQQ